MHISQTPYNAALAMYRILYGTITKAPHDSINDYLHRYLPHRSSSRRHSLICGPKGLHFPLFNAQDCFEWELGDQIVRFDSILDSLMTTDVPREKLREELSDWKDEVASIVDDIEYDAILQHERQREFATMSEELFGTEV